MNRSLAANQRMRRLLMLLYIALGVLFAKVLLSILWEYRWYFPANFQSSFFLNGRQESFEGIYRVAFYVHILCGPASILLGLFLFFGGQRARLRRFHKIAGRVLVLIVLLALAPSGFVMAFQTHFGVLAGYGFAVQAIATAACAGLSAYWAWHGRLSVHRHWANRCLILLCSPLLFRLTSGAVIVTQYDSAAIYPFNAWLSWTMPLAIYEVVRCRLGRRFPENTAARVPLAASTIPYPANLESLENSP